MLDSYLKYFMSIYSILFFFSFSHAQHENSESKADTSIASKIGWMAYPFAFYTPETELALGGGGIVHFKTANILGLNPSKIILSAYYTTNSQYYFSVKPVIYLADRQRKIIEANINYGKEILKFYGTGNNSPEIDNPNYSMKSFQFYAELAGEAFITSAIHAGPIYDFSKNDVIDKSENVYLKGGEISGSNGGIISGLGWTWLYDSRDNIFFPSKAGYYKLRLFFYGRDIGSDFTYNWYVLDLRQFFSIGASGGVLAAQFYGEITSGVPPFFKLPALGGPYRMRGYFFGRYRDKLFTTAQVEYRHIAWGRWGFAAFFGLGDVAETINQYNLNTLKYSAGFGIRFVFDKEQKINIRADFGFGKDTNGVYFSLEEAF